MGENDVVLSLETCNCCTVKRSSHEKTYGLQEEIAIGSNSNLKPNCTPKQYTTTSNRNLENHPFVRSKKRQESVVHKLRNSRPNIKTLEYSLNNPTTRPLDPTQKFKVPSSKQRMTAFLARPTIALPDLELGRYATLSHTELQSPPNEQHGIRSSTPALPSWHANFQPEAYCSFIREQQVLEILKDNTHPTQKYRVRSSSPLPFHLQQTPKLKFLKPIYEKNIKVSSPSIANTCPWVHCKCMGCELDKQKFNKSNKISTRFPRMSLEEPISEENIEVSSPLVLSTQENILCMGSIRDIPECNNNDKISTRFPRLRLEEPISEENIDVSLQSTPNTCPWVHCKCMGCELDKQKFNKSNKISTRFPRMSLEEPISEENIEVSSPSVLSTQENSLCVGNIRDIPEYNNNDKINTRFLKLKLEELKFKENIEVLLPPELNNLANHRCTCMENTRNIPELNNNDKISTRFSRLRLEEPKAEKNVEVSSPSILNTQGHGMFMVNIRGMPEFNNNDKYSAIVVWI